MIEPLNKLNPIIKRDLVDFLTSNFDYDFYFTRDNSRLYITDDRSLKDFLKESRYIFIQQVKGEFVGIILLWKSVGGGKERYYVKLCALNNKIAHDLLTVLLWNCGQDVFVKIRKDSKNLSVFRNKGFHFEGSRGIQILLRRKYIKQEVPKHERDSE